MKKLIYIAIAAIALYFIDKNYLHILSKKNEAPAPQPEPDKEIAPPQSVTGTPFKPRPQIVLPPSVANTQNIWANTGRI